MGVCAPFFFHQLLCFRFILFFFFLLCCWLGSAADSTVHLFRLYASTIVVIVIIIILLTALSCFLLSFFLLWRQRNKQTNKKKKLHVAIINYIPEIASPCNWWKSALEDHCAKVHHSAHPPFMLCVGRARRVLLVFLFSWADVVPLSSISEVSDARVRSARLFFLVLHKKCNFTLSLCNGTLCFSRHLVFLCVCVFFFGSSGVILAFFVSLFFFFLFCFQCCFLGRVWLG